MNDSGWQNVKEIFNAAMRQKPEARQQFINQACGADKSLLSEVESLISSLGKAESFMETPAFSDNAKTKILKEGFCFGHYEIIKQIGVGGMGEVYLAQDKKLDRKVAVKILHEKFAAHESNLERFTREAKAASSLNHPNILIIHEIGETDDTHYIISEFVEGKTLREIFKEKDLELKEVLDISIQIAKALAAAHEARLVHRDIKPENIMIRPDGLVKILDFGLAKLVAPKSVGFSTVKPHDTARGVIMGTVNYMSPEQAKGGKIDERTDIFSLGVVIYEMIAGRTPFADDSMPETFANLINREPKPLANVPDELQKIISKMLCKNKAGRYQTMREVLKDLKDLKENPVFEEKPERAASPRDNSATVMLQGITDEANKQTAETQNSFSAAIKLRPSLFSISAVVFLVLILFTSWMIYRQSSIISGKSGKKQSIAVLPIRPIGVEKRESIYELGITEAIIYRLGSASNLIVRPSSATRKYLETDQDPIAVGQEQKVDFVLTSSYQILDGKVHINSQLVNTQNGNIEEVFKSEKEFSVAFKTQESIALEVSNIILARFDHKKTYQTTRRGTDNEEAYRLYLQATYLIDKQNSKKAIEYLERAISLDPNYAQAYATMAWAYYKQRNWVKMKDSIDKALQLDETISEAHTWSGFYKQHKEWDFAGAEKEHLRAVELDPNSTLARSTYALFLATRHRQFDEALNQIKTAIELDPTLIIKQGSYGDILYFAQRYEDAINQFKLVFKINPDYNRTYFWAMKACEMKGDEPQAFEFFIKYQTGIKTDEKIIQDYENTFQRAGFKEVLRENLAKDKSYSPIQIASQYAYLGEKEKAFEYLEKAYTQRDFWIAIIQAEPLFDSLRDDPQFEDLVTRVGFK